MSISVAELVDAAHLLRCFSNMQKPYLLCRSKDPVEQNKYEISVSKLAYLISMFSVSPLTTLKFNLITSTRSKLVHTNWKLVGSLNLEHAVMPLPIFRSCGVSTVAREYESETWTSLLWVEWLSSIPHLLPLKIQSHFLKRAWLFFHPTTSGEFTPW